MKNAPSCPLHAPGSKHAEASWLILCLDEPGHGEVCLWWKPNAAGYTTRLDEAGRFTEAYAKLRTGGGDRAVPLSEAEGRAVRVVPLSDEDWAGIRAKRSK